MIYNSIEALGLTPLQKPTVIVGGGTLGIYAAVELAKRGREVVVIESGGEHLDNFNPETFESVGRPHGTIKAGRSRSLGGTSNLWGGQLVEFQPIDFHGRDWLSDSRWPLDYADVSAHYAQTYENLGIPTRFLTDRAVFQQVNTPVPRFDQGLELFLTRWMRLPSMAAAFRNELQNNRRLKTLLNHTVVGFRGTDGQISTVEVVDAEGRTHRIGGENFILAAGTIETVRLLLHAAHSQDWDCPWRDNQNVGLYFQDHLGGRVGEIIPIDRKKFLNLFSTIVLGGNKFLPKLRLTNDCLGRNRLLNIHAIVFCESSISENMVFLKQFLKAAIYSRRVSGVGELIRHMTACGRHLPPLMWRYLVENRVLVPTGSKISLQLQSEQMPLAASRITVDPSKRDIFGLPKVILDWRIGDEEFLSIREFTLRCQKALANSGLAEVRILKDLADGNPTFLENLRDHNHHVGGARMGWSAKDGVVDRELRVFGTKNLHVLGASTFRTSSNANTTFLALALATRFAKNLDSTRA